MKTEDEIRLIFSKLPPPILKHAGGVGPFNWFLEGFRKGESESAMHSETSMRSAEGVSLRIESD